MHKRLLTRVAPLVPPGVGYLPLLFAGALLIRVLVAVMFAGEIDGEGAEYARIAQNLLAGKGYSGIATPGTQLFFPPLFPFLIAGITWVAGDAELAGRLVSIFFGALLVVPAYFIALRLFGMRSARIAAGLVAFHPYLVFLSTTVFCEVTFLTLIALAICSAMYLTAASSWRDLAMTGVLYAASYLVRPEALVYMLVATGFILLARVLVDREPLWPAAGQLLIVPLAFLAVAVPYVAWLSVQTGGVRIEGKSPLNIATELRHQSGMPLDEAAFAVDQTLEPRGIWNGPNLDIIAAPRASLSSLAAMMIKKTKYVLQTSASSIAGSLEFGSPALFALAVLGLFGRPWRPAFALHQAHLIVLAALSVTGTYFIYYMHPRFYVLFLLLFSVWAAPAILALGRWARASAALAGFEGHFQQILGTAVKIAAVAAVILPAAAWGAANLVSARDSRAIKSAAITLSRSEGELRIADTSTPFAFHAHAEFVWLPYCDESTALTYLARNKVTHVVVQGQAADARPYLRKWMTEGIPNATRIATVTAGDRLQIFALAPPR